MAQKANTATPQVSNPVRRQRTPLSLSPSTVPSPERRISTLLVLLWLEVVSPRVIQSVTAPKFRRSAGIDYGGYTAAASATQDLFRAAVLILCAILLIGALADDRQRPIIPLLVFLTPWLWMTLRNWGTHAQSPIDTLQYPALAFAVWAMRPRITCLRTLAHLTAAAALISMTMALVDPPSALFRAADGSLISADKQIFPAGMLAGFLTQPNNLGQFISLGLPTIVLVRPAALRIAYGMIAMIAVVWTASRSSLYAVGITAAAVFVIAAARGAVRRQVSTLLITLTFGIVCALPLLTTSREAFSGRGLIWEASLPFWRQEVWFGQGADWYRDIAATSSSIMPTAFHGHNQLVQVLVTGGLVYAILVGLLLALASHHAVQLTAAGQFVGVVFLIALGGTCLLEVSLTVVDNQSLAPVTLLPLAVLSFADLAPTVLVSRDAHASENDSHSAPQVALATGSRRNPTTQQSAAVSKKAPQHERRGFCSESQPHRCAANGANGQHHLSPSPAIPGA